MLRTWIYQNRLLTTIAAVVVIALSLLMVWRSSRPPQAKRINGGWYYKLGTGELFVASIKQLPPIEADGGVGVRAYVYGCGDCAEANRFVQNLEQYNDDARNAFSQTDDPAMAQVVDNGRSVAAVPPGGESPRWIRANDPRAAAIVRPADSRCNGRKLVVCWP